ncbi:hypothetical protein F383_38882 [Gossypium arboreum]|uniref:Uncharacterized protein n=1 Tax=Gossypium arboreum TaxID=29729 RepID=A0A0B0MHV6_GOSAR|nr:hypothetical protein F383_38882 [Gossypium arboreum]
MTRSARACQIDTAV